MSGQNLGVLNAASEKMRWHEQRQKVLSQNISNADTPDYTPKDLKPLDFKSLLNSSSSSLSLSVATTNSQHITSDGTSSSSSKLKETKDKTTYETSPSGNSVILEEQMFKMSENFTDHRLTTTIYQRNIDAIKKALTSQ